MSMQKESGYPAIVKMDWAAALKFLSIIEVVSKAVAVSKMTLKLFVAHGGYADLQKNALMDTAFTRDKNNKIWCLCHALFSC